LIGDTWGFTPFTRQQYEWLRENHLLIYDGTNAKRANARGKIRTTKQEFLVDRSELRQKFKDSQLFDNSRI